MKRVLLMMLLFALMAGSAQERKYSTFYYQRATLFEGPPVTSRDIIFLGNSITNGGERSELLNDKHVKNRGVSGDICMGAYGRPDAILEGEPVRIFLLVGISDASRGTPTDIIIHRIGMTTQRVKQESPKTKLCLQSVLPVTDRYKTFGGHTPRWQEVEKVSEGLLRLADREHMTYTDLYPHFVDRETGKVNTEYANDGLHLLGEDYLKWVDTVKPYINKKWKRHYSYSYF